MKTIHVCLIGLLLAVSAAGCGKKETPPAVATPAPVTQPAHRLV